MPTIRQIGRIGFRCLDCDRSGGEILMSLPIERLSALIPDYEPESLGGIFTENE